VTREVGAPGVPADAGPPTRDVAGLLTRGQVRLLGILPRASNYTFLAEISEGEHTSLAVYKPRDGETPLWDFPDGTLHRREVAAYELSRALGWPNVPVTVLRDGPHGPGSIQRFVDADLSEHYFTLRERDEEPFRAVALFDVVANNADRKSGHCLLDAGGEIWLIDHGTCFSAEPKLRTVIWEFAGEPVPPGRLADLRRVARELRSGPLASTMTSLLTRGEVEATARRAEALVHAGRFPDPGAGRPYPWPPV
jgi:uncharacterized repeat protein (TIGR03843 family)